jgi:ParB/RepB/Spo0J family partition protein
MITETPERVNLIPIERIEVLNSRDRNMKVFEEIVENIRAIGLKKPITVTERKAADGDPIYLLVCGEGRLSAFRLLGETHIPALVVNASDEDALIMSLAENIARRGHRPLEILADIELLLSRNYAIENIIQSTGLSDKYVRDIVFLLEKGEERLITAVENGSRTTAENAREVAAIWPSLNFSSALLVTSASHMPRALESFRKAGIPVTPSTADIRVTREPLDVLDFLPDAAALAGTSDAMKERIGYLVYRMRGDL